MSALEIRWRVKDSLVGYMLRDPGFEVLAEGGGAFDRASGVVSVPAERGGDGVIRAVGAVTLRAHGGMLAVPFVGVEIDGADVTVVEPEASERLRLLTLTLAESDESDQSADLGSPASFAAHLAPEADWLFRYTYLPGTAFGTVELVEA